MSSVSCVISAVRCQVSSQHVRRREVHVRLPERVRATASQRLQVRQGPWHAAGGVQLLSAHVRRKWKFIQIRMYILFTTKEPGQFHFTIIQLFHWNASSHTNRSTYFFFDIGYWSRVNTAMSSSWFMDKYLQRTDAFWALARSTLLICLKQNGLGRTWSPSNTLW